jgi:hypothetical protein
MQISKVISIPVFILSLCVGVFFVYITIPNPDVILVYPNPDNTEKLLFKDDAGVCHKFVPREVKCPSDLSKIRKYPVSLKK